MTTTTVNQIFANARKERGFGQEEVARKIGYSSSQQISNFERGVTTLPLNKLKKLCKVLGVPTKRVYSVLVEDYERQVSDALN